jgi:hypothetical protein
LPLLWAGAAEAGSPPGAVAAPSKTVALWQPLELAFKGPAESKPGSPGPQGGSPGAAPALNPFVDVRFTVRFHQDAGTTEVLGFYDGRGTYRVRFLAPKVGLWHYTTVSGSPALEGIEGDFTVTKPSAGPAARGPIAVVRTSHFAHADGTPFHALATDWPAGAENREATALKAFSASAFDLVSVPVLPTEAAWGGKPPSVWPFAERPAVGGARGGFDPARLDPRYFERLENRIRALGRAGVEVELVLFPGEGGPSRSSGFDFDRMAAEDDDRYVRYVVARFSAFPNVWWSLGDREALLASKRQADLDRLGKLVAAEDAYHHPRSVTSVVGSALDLGSRPWVTHAVVRAAAPAATLPAGKSPRVLPVDLLALRKALGKPLVVVESTPAGGAGGGGGDGDGGGAVPSPASAELIDRLWRDVLAGVGVHLQVRADGPRPAPGGVAWSPPLSWSAVGALHGTALPRLAFLARVLKGVPAGGDLEPVDAWPGLGGPGAEAPGFYLAYFGEEGPPSWTFQLPVATPATGPGPADGTAFKAELLDTWNMTAVPLPGPRLFVSQRAADGSTISTDPSPVALPSRPYLALRITRQP